MQRDVRVQLEINTGGGAMCPVSDDHFVTGGMMRACELGGGLMVDGLDKMPATDAAADLNHALAALDGYDVPHTLSFLKNLLGDCLAHPAAVVSIIEV